ncbi:MAG: hypothetical protein CVV03_11510 [Firmicutes bacterium HGW-Firmicutes-8]|nr:MAG: hypothetical protein CVV03_11510 [Firmicutes bacterium HGW-Firmicutes-8]
MKRKVTAMAVIVSGLLCLTTVNPIVKGVQKETIGPNFKLTEKELTDEEKIYNTVHAYEKARNVIDYTCVTGCEGLDYYTQRARCDWLKQGKHKSLCQSYKMKKENSNFDKIDGFDIFEINKNKGRAKVKAQFSRVVISFNRAMMIKREKIGSTVSLVREKNVWKIDKEESNTSE